MAYVPDEAIDRFPELTAGEQALYLRLCKYRCGQVEDENYGLAFPSRKTLAAEMDCVPEYVSQVMSSLTRKEWVKKIGWKVLLLVGFSEGQKLDNSYKLESKKILKSKNLKGQKLESETQKLENQPAHIRNKNQLEPKEPIEEIPTPSAPVVDAAPKEIWSAPYDRMFKRIFAEFHKGEPYLHEIGKNGKEDSNDFVRLGRLWTAHENKLPLDQFEEALLNYFSTPQGKYTLADFCMRYATFRVGPLNDYGKPANGHGPPGSTPSLWAQTRNTQNNPSAFDAAGEIIKNRTKTG